MGQGYTLPQRSREKKEFKERIDFEVILWKAIDSMREGIIFGDMVQFINSLEALEILLAPRITQSPKYREEMKKIDEEYEKAQKRSKEEKSEASNKRSKAWARALMHLIEESGLLPEESGEYEED